MALKGNWTKWEAEVLKELSGGLLLETGGKAKWIFGMLKVRKKGIFTKFEKHKKIEFEENR
jgi:hypothetical protein